MQLDSVFERLHCCMGDPERGVILLAEVRCGVILGGCGWSVRGSCRYRHGECVSRTRSCGDSFRLVGLCRLDAIGVGWLFVAYKSREMGWSLKITGRHMGIDWVYLACLLPGWAFRFTTHSMLTQLPSSCNDVVDFRIKDSSYNPTLKYLLARDSQGASFAQ